MRLELQVKVFRPAGVALVSRMGLVVIELLLIGGQQEENGSRRGQSSNAVLMQK